jgi:hypothetical protein
VKAKAKKAKSKKSAKLNVHGVTRSQAHHIAGDIIDNALARSNGFPTEATAAVAIARAWLAKAGFHEDGVSPERVEIGFSDVGAKGERYVNVRLYVPAIDVDHVVDGTHPDGITVKAAA